MRIHTVGHSSRSADEFLALLDRSGLRCVADVRARPGSRRHPQFGRDALAASLRANAIGYEHIPQLGGRRKPVAGSRNTGWKTEGFCGYADHLATATFEKGIDRLLSLAEGDACAIMCAERDPAQCHRYLIADALVLRGMEVVHVLGPGSTERHEFTAWAGVDRGRPVYPFTLTG